MVVMRYTVGCLLRDLSHLLQSERIRIGCVVCPAEEKRLDRMSGPGVPMSSCDQATSDRLRYDAPEGGVEYGTDSLYWSECVDCRQAAPSGQPLDCIAAAIIIYDATLILHVV